MPITVNTNVTSMRAQGNTNRANNMVAQSMQRLSSGLRINSAKDDAAGLAISNRLTSQMRGLDVAQRNANDGISIAQTAEGAMQESTNILQRMRDLSLQSANGSNSNSDRVNMQKEIAALQSELTRISDTTRFGDIKLLDGNFGSRSFQVGANANETIGISLQNIASNAIGRSVLGVTGNATQTISGNSASTTLTLGTDDTTITIGAIGASGSLDASGLADAINSVDGISGVAVTGGVVTPASNTVNPATNTLNLSGLTSSLVGNETLDLVIGTGLSQVTVNLNAGNTDTIANLESAISTAIAGVAGNPYSSAVSGTSIDITSTDTATAFTVVANNYVDETNGSPNGTLDLGLTIGGTAIGGATTTGTGNSTIVASTTNTTPASRTDFSVDFTNAKVDEGTTALELDNSAVTLATTASLLGVNTIDIGTDTGAQNALEIIDAAIKSIDENRADLGAIQNRLGHTISNLGNIQNNVADSRSRILDVDFAKETANMTKQQILLQTSTAMLSQANQIPQIALSLLQ
ncbi:flagellin [Parashewanella spongiae]|uniref:Flagellin n=1 Tax=Parashewanella spongiae TaxID=342950 RepID=A0A3A6TTM2_9GAMM|nr:flagellin [Parashewanella spongiae]MCL1076621.1 flagellin [Parashewanella spongiae]RJY19575.1 flagellin [Parashewanella spongiae]